MNLEYTLQGITFEWDSRKAAASLKEHRIQFETACEAFFDPFVLTVEEPVHLEERRDDNRHDDRLASGVCAEGGCDTDHFGTDRNQSRKNTV